MSEVRTILFELGRYDGAKSKDMKLSLLSRSPIMLREGSLLLPSMNSGNSINRG